MSRPWVAIQRNPRSGSGKRKRRLIELARALRKHDIRPHIFSSREQLDERLCDPERREALVGIVAAGGDGTIGDVINRHSGIPICPFPLGTENVLSKYLGIPLDGDFVARVIASGNRKQFDLGLAGESQKFLLMASSGFDAEVIRRLHEGRRGNISHWSYLKPMWQTACRYSYPELTVRTEETDAPVRGSLVVVSNFPAYAMKLPINPDAKPDDGLLTVRVFRDSGFGNLLRYWSQVVRRTHLDRDDVQVLHSASLTIECEAPNSCSAPVQIDGDPCGTAPLSLKTLPSELELFVPAGM